MQSPVIDDSLNVYVASTTGWIYSLSAQGQLNWELDTKSVHPANLALSGDAIYTATLDSTLLKIQKDSGRELFRTKISEQTGAADSHAILVAGETVLVSCNLVHDAFWSGRPHEYGGGDSLCALAASDGHFLWNYSIATRAGVGTYNAAPAVVGDAVLVSDRTGAVYCLSLADGSERWRAPSPAPGSWTTGGLAVGPSGAVYAPANRGHPSAPQPCFLRALDISNGTLLWSREFHEPANAPPAVGPVCCGKQRGHQGQREMRLAVVVAIGSNPSCTPFGRMGWTEWLELKLGRRPTQQGVVVALSPRDGSTLWSFHLPPSLVGQPAAGITASESCCPDLYGPLSIGADGTVHLNWAGGKTLALKDANGDGKVDAADPLEVSSYDHGLSSQSGTAIAPGLSATSNCRHVLGYLS